MLRDPGQAIYARRQMTEHQVFGKFKRDETPGSPRNPPRHPCLFLQTWMTSSLARFRLSSYGPKHRFSTIHVSPRVLSNSGLLQMSGRTSYEVFVTISMNKTQQVERPGYPSALSLAPTLIRDSPFRRTANFLTKSDCI